jgi:azurin
MFRFALAEALGEVANIMRTRLFFISALVALVTSGCGQKDPASTASGAPVGPRTVEITAGDTMKYSVTAIQAAPGEEIKVVLTNNGTQPKEVMGHNWVLLKAGTDVAAFDAAALMSKDTDYIPAALAGQILAKIDLLGPRKSGEVDFKAPTVPGEYHFLCTFPAHYQTGMTGILTVK